MNAAHSLRIHRSVKTEKAVHSPDSAEKIIYSPALQTARLRSHSHPPAHSSTPSRNQSTLATQQHRQRIG